MSSLVADASFLVTLLIATDHTRGWAEALAQKADVVHVPQLARIEVLNNLRKLEFRELYTPQQTETVVQLLMDMPLQEWPLDGLHARVWSLRHNVSPYDAWYVALAEYLEVPLATCDARLARANGPTCAFLLAS